MNDKQLLTSEEAVAYLRLDLTGTKNPVKTLEYYRRRGFLKGRRVGRQIRYTIDDLKDFLNKVQVGE